MRKVLYLVVLLILVGVNVFVYAHLNSKSIQDTPHRDLASSEDIPVWNVSEFEIWMNEKLAEYQELVEVSSKTYYEKNNEGIYVAREWTQKDVDMYRELWDEQLQMMKDGYIFTKPIDNERMVGMFASDCLN